MDALEAIKDKLIDINFETISLARGNAKKEILIDDVEEVMWQLNANTKDF